MTKKQHQKIVDAKIQKAVGGFVIPMMSIPKLYRAMEACIYAEGSDADLNAIVAAFPGVTVST